MRGALPSATLDPQGSEATEGVDKTNHHSLLPITYPPPPHCVVLTPVSGGESGCSAIAGHCGYNFTATADCPSETGGESGCSVIARTLSPLFPIVTIPLSCRRVGGESVLLFQFVRPSICHLYSVICHLSSVLCHLSSVLFRNIEAGASFIAVEMIMSEDECLRIALLQFPDQGQHGLFLRFGTGIGRTAGRI